ncbi:MAG: hypothetical protein IKZ48_02700 [Prevotella sp.]|nr:hypothetical protein [Prevotella sp.]
MKREYQKPTTLVVQITTSGLICGSITEVSGVTGLDISDDDTSDAGITTAGSRYGSLWDEDDEDEEEEY